MLSTNNTEISQKLLSNMTGTYLDMLAFGTWRSLVSYLYCLGNFFSLSMVKNTYENRYALERGRVLKASYLLFWIYTGSLVTEVLGQYISPIFKRMLDN